MKGDSYLGGMKAIPHSRSHFVEIYNVRDSLDQELFESQLLKFFIEMSNRVDEWKGPCDGVSLHLLEQELFELYGISSQALRYLARREQSEDWHRSKSIDIGQELATLHICALEDCLELGATDFQELFAVEEGVGMMFTASTDPAVRNLKPFDQAGWERILLKECPGMRVVSGARAKAAAAMKAKKCARGGGMQLTKSQEELAAILKSFWKLKKSGVSVAGYNLRPIPLIVGPSGSGKTALVRDFAQSNKLPMCDFNVGTWLVTGARAEPSTLTTIARFVEANEHGVLFIDEVDKLYGTSDWLHSIQQEIFALLDQRTDSFVGWSDEVHAKFAANFFIVGAGTWQALYSRNGKKLGFHQEGDGDDWSIRLAEQAVIPEELLMRFNADVLYLKPLEVQEFATRITRIVSEAGHGPLSPDRLKKLSEQAHASGRHNRWLEAFASRVVRSNSLRGRESM